MSLCRRKPASKTHVNSTDGIKSGDPSPRAANCGVACLTRLIRKVKRQGKSLLSSSSTGRQSSFQCRYDPLSYSLNFDGGACGSLADEEDYYLRFYAFSSRFAVHKRPAPHETLAATSR